MVDLGVPVLDTSALKRVGARLGSNPAGVFEDALGQRYYVKALESAAHARNEYLAAALYQLAGAPTLRYVRTTDPCAVATEFVRLDKKYLAQLTDGERREAQRWLGVHAWTANWDAAGYTGDNQGVADGRVLTLDVGGALEFRAQGDPKGRAFGTEVGELDALRTDADNPHSVRLFCAMRDDDLHDAIAVVTRIPDAAIRATIAEHGGSPALAEKMIARKRALEIRLAAQEVPDVGLRT